MGINIIRSSVRATGGTQVSEYAAAIKSVTSSTTVGAVFLYDCSADSDGGKWRKKCKGLSWFDEAASATRSARSEFPAMALIVADNAGASSGTVTIYDLDDPAMPMWMVFNVTNTSWLKHFTSAGNVSCVTMLNGRLITGGNGNGARLSVISFPDDNGYASEPGYNYEHFGIINRQTPVGAATGSISIVNSTVNDGAATVLEGAEIGALGLPEVTISVATAGGISWIHPNGDVFDSTAYGAFDEVVAHGRDEWVGSQFAGTEVVRIFKTAYADGHTEHASREYAATSTPAILDGDPAIASTSDGIAAGTANGLTLIKDNPATSAGSAVAHVTSDYNTGYMLGDIRGAWLAYGISCGHSHADHVQTAFSVKANTLTETGTLTKTAVATGADLTGFSGWSSSNYLSRAYDTDFNFTDGKFSVMGWVKVVASSTYQAIVNRYSGSDTAKGWLLYLNPEEKAYMHVYGASSVNTGMSGILSDGWHFICAVSDGAKIKIYTAGALANSGTLAAGDLSNTAAELHVGIEHNESDYPCASSLSLLRVSATVPTPQQIKEIYDAEKPLFAANAKCLLQSDDAGPNVINALSHDKSTDLLHVFQNGNAIGETMFRGLEAVDSYGGQSNGWSYSSTVKGAAAGGVVCQVRTAGTGGVLVDLPALDVRAELNQSDDKLPDDGKWHFSGVTTDATVTTIAEIPMAPNERMAVRAKVQATEYQATGADTDERLSGEVRRGYRCDMAGSRDQDGGVTYKFVDAVTSTMDIDWGHNSSKTAALKVTGVAGTRIEWTASVEVQRISEKTYER